MGRQPKTLVGHARSGETAKRRPRAAPTADDSEPDVGALDSSNRPVFLVSGFRTSSTWLWGRLRAASTTTAFYEIFNPGLATFKPRDVHQSTPTSWHSNHPGSAGYFLEYLPLIQETGGVPGYDASMAIDSFLPVEGFDGDLTPDEHAYVASLVAHAQSDNRVPILTCTRILGRSRALRKAFPSRTVLLHRNIFHQWASCSFHAAAGNPYFLEQIERTIASSRHDPFIHSLDDWFQDRTTSHFDEAHFTIFCLLHLYLYAKAFDATDLAVDATAIATDPSLRTRVERDLSSMVGANIDLSDVTSNFESSLVEVRSKPVFVDTIEQFTKAIITFCDSPDAAVFVQRLKEDLLGEWSRHEFFVRRTRGLFAGRRTELETLVETERAKAAILVAERDALSTQLTEAAVARTTADKRMSKAVASIVMLESTLAEAQNACRETNRAMAILLTERDRLAVELARPTIARFASRLKRRFTKPRPDPNPGR